ncbi:hypothetical protein CD30_14835 [Ureibacillus massiliensis 4400831 = CIP 108448 = CCUG 49529]|uniref:Uncharacterized protein n=1 Tax=Ureibacillus massiliensis 4400831 = CIP 108448 = CCUG 49529 TaxID=1211035 RepID=A0A0A3IYV3_9BACL|nr:hypothetical protein CD30_14835 [Ureibacillus massiliensis 4400831 = CIP 108448 = CCUG 49529]
MHVLLLGTATYLLFFKITFIDNIAKTAIIATANRLTTIRELIFSILIWYIVFESKKGSQ